MPRLFLFLGKESRVFDCHRRFAGKHAHQFHVPFVKYSFLLAVHRHHADCAVVKNQWHGANRSGQTSWFEAQALGLFGVVVSNQQRLARSDHVFGQVIPGRASSFGQPIALYHIDFKSYLLSLVVVERDKKTTYVEQPFHLRINAVE